MHKIHSRRASQFASPKCLPWNKQMRTDNPCDSPYVLMSRIHPCLPVHPLWIRHRLQVSFPNFPKQKTKAEIKGAPPPKFNYSSMIIKGCRGEKKEVHQVVRPVYTAVNYISDVQSIWVRQDWEHKLLKCLSGVETALEEWRNCITCNNVNLPVGFSRTGMCYKYNELCK